MLLLPTIFLSLSALSSVFMGAVVLARNPYSRPHRAFGALSINIAVWTVGVLAIIHCRTAEMAALCARATFCAGAFLPATFFHFILLFPGPNLRGPKWLLVTLYTVALTVSLGAWTPWYLRSVDVSPSLPPVLAYGPVFYLFAASIFTGMLFAYPNLFAKWREASGIQRRQIEHVLLGIVFSTFLASATNVMAPLLEVRSLEFCGPIFMVLMTAIFSYSMVRYHLLDIWAILSRTTVYAVVTSIVVVTFLGTISLVHWALQTARGAGDVLSSVLAALVIALVLQPIKERVQLVLNRTVLRQHHDLRKFLARAGRNAARIVRLQELLQTVCRDIEETIGPRSVRVLLFDEGDPRTLTTAYSSRTEELGRKWHGQGPLLEAIQANAEPLLLEQLIHERPSEAHVRLAGHLAELDAYLCVPLQATSGLVGMLTLGQKDSRDIYTMDEVMVFAALASPLAAAIENARLYHKLEEVNQHRERILSQMRGGVVAIDIHRKVTTVNQFAIDLLGPIEPGQDVSNLPGPVRDLLHVTLEERRAIADYETSILRPDGESVPVAMSSSCLASIGNGPLGAMVIVFDLSEIRRLQRNVQGAQRLSSLGTLAAGMAHEIKNPLVSIKTFTQLLPTRYDDADFRATVTAILPQEVERINTIVTRLLEFARPKPVHFAPQNLREIVEEVLALIATQARKAGVDIETEFPDEIIDVLGDEQQLHQVFLNLVLNSIDAMKHTDRRTLSVHCAYASTRLRSQEFPGLREVDCIKVAVVDTGCGVPAEDIDKLLTPFYTTKADGIGLGLSVVHGIVTEHGGQLEISSTVGEGTCIEVVLPLAAKLAEVQHAEV